MTLKNTTDRFYLLFICLAFICLIIGLGSYGLAETSEARYAEISREMLITGDYLNPQLLGIFHFHKPPITYYITSLGYQIFGINEFGARFFLQVAVILQLLFIYGLAQLLFKSKKIAFLSGLIYFSIPIVLISTRNLTTDAYLTTFIIASIYCWQYYTITKNLLFLYGFYLLLGLGILTKGPVAILFILVYTITNKIIFKSSFKINIHHILGSIICLSLGTSWFTVVMIENPKLWDYFIEKQIAGRITGNSFSERSKPSWFFFPIIIGLLLPWLIGSIPKFKFKMRSLSKICKESQLLLIASIVLLLIFSSFSTKLILYILPVFWMLAIFIAKQLDALDEKSQKYISISYLVILSLLFISLLVCWYFQFELISIQTISIITSFMVVIIAYGAYFFLDTGNSFKPALISAFFGVSILLISGTVLKTNSPLINSTRHMANFIKHISKEEDKTILVYDYLLTSIPFYSNAEYITLQSSHRTTDREVQFQNDKVWKKQLWDVNTPEVVANLKLLSKERHTFLLVRNRSELNENIQFLRSAFDQKKEYPGWTIFYNR